MKKTDFHKGGAADIDPASPRPAASGDFLPVGVPVAAVIMKLRNRTLVRVLADRREEDTDGQR